MFLGDILRTGTASRLQALLAVTGTDKQDYLVDHNNYIYLLDPQGAFMRGFDAQTPGDRVADSVRKTMAQWPD